MNDLISISALRRLLAAIGGDRDDLEELRNDFLETTPELVHRLADAHARGDLKMLRITAHELKSNARDFGAVGLADHCEALESCAKAGAKIEQHVIDDIVQSEEAARASLATTDLSDV